MVRAVIYCRVSSEKQMSDGAGLKSQETRCRGFAKERGYKVEKVFADQAISGALQDRPAVTELVDFLIENKNNQIVIIIDDVSRLARDIQVYYTLKAVISKYGAIIESPSHNFFTENPENKLIESVSVSLAEYERNKNTQRVINRMKARLEDGFWTFQGFPKCFEFKTVRGSGKVLVHSSLAQTYVEAMEGYAFNRFATVVEAHKFLLDHDIKILYSKFCEVLRNPLIAGYLKYSKWGISFRKAKHEGIISLEVFQKIQTKLDNKTPKQVNTKTDLQKDFPLRGYVKCVETESKFTGGWSTNGNGVKQPYYQARVTIDQRQQKGFRSRSFQRDKVHQELEKELAQLEPEIKLLELTRAIFVDFWNSRSKEVQNTQIKGKKRLDEIKDDFKNLVDKITKTKSDILSKALESKLEDLDKEKILLESNIEAQTLTTQDFQTALNKVLDFVKNPLYYWKNGNLDIKKSVLRLCFQDYLFYSEKDGFQTPDLTLPFKLFRRLSGGYSPLVEMGGVAPPSSWVWIS